MPDAAPGWGSCSTPLAEHHDVLLLDLDGVIYVGPHAVPGAPQALERARRSGARLAYVTNNAARPPDAVARHLTQLGVPAEATDVVTSAQAAAAMLSAELPSGARVLAIGGEGLRQALTARGLTPVASADDEPVAVVQGFAPETSWKMLLEACVAVNAGLPWVATNLDLTIPTPRGTAPGNGALVQVVRTATGATPRVAGKPFRPLMDESVVRTEAARPLVVGDRLDTDIAGAHAAGLPSLLVLTGITGAADLLRATPESRPTYLSADLWGLHQPQAAPRRDGRAWVGTHCRAAWTAGGEISTRRDDTRSREFELVVESLSADIERRDPAVAQAAAPADADAGVVHPAEELHRAEALQPAGTVHSAEPSEPAGTTHAAEASSRAEAWNGLGALPTNERPSRGEAPSGAVDPAASPGGDGAERSADASAASVDALRVVCAAVWEQVDRAVDAAERDRIVAAGEQALRPWAPGLGRAR